MRDIVFRTPTTQQDALALVECCRTNPGRLSTLLLAWRARGLDLNAPLEGKTLLHQAVLTQRHWLVEGLLAAGASPMAPTEGQPAFLVAAYYNEIEAVKAMLETGHVEIHATGIHGQTAAHYAALNGNADLLKLLLAHGANLFLANDSGQTPLDLADSWTHHTQSVHAAQAMAFLKDVRPRARAVTLGQALEPPTAPDKPRIRF